MDIFAGNFSLQRRGDIPDIDYDIIQTGEKSFFIMGAHDSITDTAGVIALLETEF